MRHAKAIGVLLLNIPMWAAYTALVAVLWLIGVPLIWHQSRARGGICTVRSRVWPDRMVMGWRRDWMTPVWGNEQDGIDGRPFSFATHSYVGSLPDWDSRPFRSMAARVFQWSAIRNSTNNLRFIHHFYPGLGWLNPRTIHPERIRSVGVAWPLGTVAEGHRFAYSLVWQFPYAGLKVAFRIGDRAHQFWFGWKLNAGMADPHWWPEDPCWHGVGFTAGQVRHSA